MRTWTVVLLALGGCPEPPPPSGLPSPAPAPVTPPPEPTPPPTPEPTPVPTAELRVVSYNVESGDAEPVTIAGHVGRVDGEHLWGFQEVLDQSWLDAFTVAANDVDGEEDFANVLGTTGGADRLGAVWDTRKLTYVTHTELMDLRFGNFRAPLVVTFDLVETGDRFLFVVNHLARTNAAARRDQATGLNAWAAQQTLPLISAGDFNFDWDVASGDTDRDPGYDDLVADDVWTWVRPTHLIKTQCAFSEDAVLDFVFVAGPAQEWDAVGDILLRQSIFCDDNPQTPDHRPVDAVFQIPLPPADGPA
jgi:endonuclease/exonuclease/phosphatase family metal-dependent hydrolase